MTFVEYKAWLDELLRITKRKIRPRPLLKRLRALFFNSAGRQLDRVAFRLAQKYRLDSLEYLSVRVNH